VKQRKRRISAPALVIGDTAEPAIDAAIRDGNIWPLTDMLRSETCPRQAREFAADLIERKVTLPDHRPVDPLRRFVIAAHVEALKSSGMKPYLAVEQTALDFGCSKPTIYAELRAVAFDAFLARQTQQAN
jgi:3-oxoacyl-(acyl-carrier-protein) synthase